MNETRSEEEATSPHASREAPFRYQPLHANGNQNDLRVLKIIAPSPDDQIHLELVHIDQRTCDYRCLSYMWGVPDDGYRITVNDQTFPVRKNLFDFLKTTAQRFADLPLWIDAICIDQNNNTEKGQEVKRMSHIYHEALEVIVWLGIDDDFGHLFTWATDLGSHYSRLFDNAPEGIMSAMERLFTHPYWTRIWITQEILLARKTTLSQGTHEVDFNHLYYAIVPKIPHDGFFEETALSRLLVDWNPLNKGLKRMSFFQLLTSRFDGNCTDPRDRIYAMLAIVASKGLREFDVDYDEDFESLFWRAGSHFNAWINLEYVNLLRGALKLSLSALRLSAPSKISIYAVDCNFRKESSYKSAQRYINSCSMTLGSRDSIRALTKVLSRGDLFAARLFCPDIWIPSHPKGVYTNINIDRSLNIRLIPFSEYQMDHILPTIHLPRASIWFSRYVASDGEDEWSEIKSWKALKVALRGLGRSRKDESRFRIDIPASWVLEQLE